MVNHYFSENDDRFFEAPRGSSGSSKFAGALDPVKISYRLGQTSIETYTNAQALLLVTISAPGFVNPNPSAMAATDITLHISPDENVREVTVLSRYDVTSGAGGMAIHCGNLAAGDERYVLLRLRCGPGAGPQPLAELTLDYRSPGGNRMSQTSAFVAVERANEAYVPTLDAIVARTLASVSAAAGVNMSRKTRESDRGFALRAHSESLAIVSALERARDNARRNEGFNRRHIS